MNHLFDDSWVTLPLSFLYNPSFSTPWASFPHFSFGEKVESPRVRVYLRYSREERILFMFSSFSIPSKFVKWEKLFQVWKLKTSHTFLKHKALFHQTSNFFFHRTPWDKLFDHRLYIEIEWDMFVHDPEWKSYHMKSSSFFSVFGQIFIARAWFWLFIHFVKFVSLRTSSTQNHMRIGNQVHDLWKFIFKLPESFQHL